MTGVPPARQCTLPDCERPAVDPNERGGLCAACKPDKSAERPDDEPESEDANPGADAEDSPSSGPLYAAADFTNPNSGTWPATRLEWEQWMGHKPGEKQPYAPWTAHDAPAPCDHHDAPTACAECDHSARYKWGWAGNYVTGDEIAMAEADPALAGRVFLQQPADPYAYVDGDDVRCPESGAVHPAFLAVLNRLGLTYADISQSERGSHAIYRGELPEGVKEASWQLDSQPWGDNDDCPSIEIYAGKRVCVDTGRHVPGTPTKARPWDDDALRAVLDENDQLPAERGDRSGYPFDDFDLEDYDPDATTPDETAKDVRDIFAALDRLDAQRVAARTIVAEWNDDAGTSDGERAFHPIWDPNCNGTANIVNSNRWLDTGDRGGYGGVATMAAIDAGLVPESHEGGVRGETFFEAVDHLRDLGFNLPQLQVDSERVGRGHEFPIVECEPPDDERESFDVDAHRKQIQERTRDWFAEGGLRVFADDAGTGKTTNAGIAAGADKEPHAILCERHDKAREFVTDEPTPDDYFHVKGATQKRETVCMDADHADEECPVHGHDSVCPAMCPVYNLPGDDDFREFFDRLVEEVGPVEAHVLVEPHDGEGCAFLEQFNEARDADQIVGVHQYLRLSTVTDGRQVIVDEKPASLTSERNLSPHALTLAANELIGHAGNTAVGRTLQTIGTFARRLVDVVLGVGDAPDAISDLDPPTVAWNAYETYNEVAGNHIEYVAPEEDWHIAEALAKAKVAYNEALLRRVRDDDKEWDGTPLCFDALLAAAAEAGLDREQVCKAIAAPPSLRDCPRCSASVEFRDGRGICPKCDLDEAADTITQSDTEPARAHVWVDRREDDDPALVYEHLPLTSDLPDDALVLDATPTAERIDALFNDGSDAGTVTVEGEAALELENLNLTQVLNGQYHSRTIKESDRLQERIQALLDTAGALYDQPLFLLKSGLKQVFDFPENAEVMHYHAVRGLNRDECDAAFCIGAPHADVDDLRREAKLLAMHRDDIRVGGEEYSTRRDASGDLAANPPVYRKLNYEDDNGQGRAVPTKAFSGLVGDLFRETREKELVQAVHRTRPLLADETVDAYLVTNVPTSLPVDQVAGLAELAEPLRSFLPVPEGAVRLLEHIRDVEVGEGPDGFRADSLVETTSDSAVSFNRRGFHRLARLNGEDVTYRTVCNWVDAIDDLGLVEPGEYVQDTGVRFSVDTAALKSALAVTSTNVSFKAAAKRRFARITAIADGSLAWLRWARDVLGLTGNREYGGGHGTIGAYPPPTGD